jgi:hypothetical protein
MNQNSQKKTSDHMINAIFALDLDPIKRKLMDKREGLGWNREEADRHEMEYRRFLALVAKYPDEVVAPNINVDKFWHAHILDTMKYAEDCDTIFGYFLHHFPYFGMRDEEDAANLAKAAQNMQRLYQQEFGEGDPQATAYCGVVAGKSANGDPASAYCGVVAGKAESDAGQASAYCGIATASYCGVVAGKGRPRLPESTAYCGVVAGKPASQEDQSGYCGAVAGKSNVQEGQTAYCGIANASYCGVVAGKGRPGLEQTATCAA